MLQSSGGLTTRGSVKKNDVIKNRKIIRPLIEISREEIEEYCEIKQLKPRHDESNEDNIYTRNKIRNMLIPYIKKNFNPNIVETINRLSCIAKEEDAYLMYLAKKEFENVCVESDARCCTVTK